MSIDLERSLAELAGSVGDDATTARMTGQVHHMVTRIRRRRAARHAATGAVSVGAAGAVAFGGLQLADRPGAPGGLEVGAFDPAVWGCEPDQALPAPIEPRTVELETTVVPPPIAGEVLEIRSVLASQVQPQDYSLELSPTAYLARDGVIVAQGSQMTTTLESFPPQAVLELPLVSCARPGEPIPAGDYTLVTRQPVVVDGIASTIEARQPLQVLTPDGDAVGQPTASPTTAPSPDPDTAVTSPPQDGTAGEDPGVGVATGPYPACGAEVPAPEPSVPLELVVAPEGSSDPPAPEVTLRATDADLVILNRSEPTLVYVSDGRVVGRSPSDAGDAALAEVGPDGIALRAQAMAPVSCAGDGLQPLEPGTYGVQVVLEGALKEIWWSDSEVESRSDAVVLSADNGSLVLEGAGSTGSAGTEG